MGKEIVSTYRASMILFSVSIVLYKTDLTLLRNVLVSLRDACFNLSAIISVKVTVDLINNDTNNQNDDKLLYLIKDFYRDFYEIKITDSEFNGGYGYGNNISIKNRFDSDYHLVLNPDVILDANSLSNGISYMQSHLDVGLLTPQVRGFNNELHYLCKCEPKLFDMIIRCLPFLKYLFKNRSSKFEMRDKDYNNIIIPVPYPTGCFMIFRGSVLRQICGFDEKFFLHFEDADIGRRTNLVSKVAYVPTVLVFHKWARSTHKSIYMKLITIKSGLRYFFKWR